MNLSTVADWSLLIFCVRKFKLKFALRVTDVIFVIHDTIYYGNNKSSFMWILPHQTTHAIDVVMIVL